MKSRTRPTLMTITPRRMIRFATSMNYARQHNNAIERMLSPVRPSVRLSVCLSVCPLDGGIIEKNG